MPNMRVFEQNKHLFDNPNEINAAFDVEPIHYVAHAMDVPILLESVEGDPFVKKDGALLYQETVSSSEKEILWYARAPDASVGGHGLGCDASKFEIAWLGQFIDLNNANSFKCRKR